MDEVAVPAAYIARANVLEYEATWRLGADALELQGGPASTPDAVMRVPYREIVAVRLSYAPSRFDHARYRCDLHMRSGQRLAILSTHYAGIANFEDRGASYAPFVRALIARVAEANPAVRLQSGKNVLVYMAEHVFLIVAFALLVVVLSAFGPSYLSESSTKLLVVVAAIPVLIAYARKNCPRRFRPDGIPDDVLPAAPR